MKGGGDLFFTEPFFREGNDTTTQDTNKQNLLSSHGQSPKTMSSAAQSEDLVDDVNCNDIAQWASSAIWRHPLLP